MTVRKRCSGSPDEATLALRPEYDGDELRVGSGRVLSPATSGAHITLLFEPNDSKQTTVKVIAGTTVEERTTDIKQP